MRLAAALKADPFILTEGSVYELLRRDPRVAFDPHIAHSGLIYDPPSREILAAVHRAYLSIATPMIAFADTWRASGPRVAASRFHGRTVNRDNVAFLRELAPDAILGALTAPAGDAYRPGEAPRYEAARDYHAPQIEELAASGADFLMAATLPAHEEARAIGSLMAETGLPWILSFVVREDGTLLDGTPFGVAIESLDGLRPAGFSVNCVHPRVFRKALETLTPAQRARVIAFQANTSARPPEDLGSLGALETESPEIFARDLVAAIAECGVPIAGGCCGTSPGHIEAVARLLVA